MRSPSPRVFSLTRVSIAILTIVACAPDQAITAPESPKFESQEASVVVSSVAPKATSRPAGDAIGSILERLVPSLDQHGSALRTALLVLQSRPSDRAASDALLRTLETIGATLPPAYRPDLDAIRLELDAVALR